VVFARSADDEPQVITVVTRVALDLERLGGWGEHTIQLPEGTWRDLLTGHEFEGGATMVATVLKSMPVALLERT
jgi:(1->4)-alpha-D-glucan 1-alpha-D-glucosylmutase